MVSAREELHYLRRLAEAIGENQLDFKPEHIGIHATRSASAMAMFLENTPIFLFMLIGH